MEIRKKPLPLFPLVILILLGIIWGTGYSIARFAMLNGVSPLGYGLWQSLGPALLLAAIATYRGKLPTHTIKHRFYYLVCGLTGIIIPNTTMYFAAPHLPASILAMVVNTVPIAVYPLALLMQVERFNWQRIAGIGLAILALMLIILPKSSLPSPNMVPWVLISLLAPLSFAVCSIYIARYQPNNMDSLTLSVGMLTVSSSILLPIVFATHNFYFFHFPLTFPDYVVLLEILLSSVGYLLFFKLIKMAGPVFYSLVDTVVVLAGLFWGYMIFDEKLNQWTGMAVYLILVALLLVTRQQRSAAILKDQCAG